MTKAGGTSTEQDFMLKLRQSDEGLLREVYIESIA